MNSPVVIIGGSPAAPTAAYEPTKLGARAVLVAAEQQSRGLARTVSDRGYRFDTGGHHPDAQAGDRSVPVRHPADPLSLDS